MENKKHNQNKKNNNNLKNKNSSNKKKELSLFEKYSPINNINYNNINQEKENKHIYLNYYTNQQKEKNIEKETLNQKFHDKNIKFLKLKEIENKKKKENEIKKKKQEEYENTKEFRDKQIEKLYLGTIIKDNRKNSQKKKNLNNKKINNNNNNLENNENNGKINEYINKFQQKEIERIEKEKLLEKIRNLPKGTIIIKKDDYENILNNLHNERKIYNEELNKMPLSNKTHKQKMRESYLINLLDEIDKKIEKLEKKISIEIIDI